jgi:DNA polymerase I
MAQSPSLLLVDGHSLAFRAYYAFAKGRDGGLRTSTGIPTSVTFGFLKSLLEVLNQHQPDYVALTFDLGGPTYRHEADESYKAGRAETPEDFIPDVDNLREVLAALNLKSVIVSGYEADDVIGTLARQAAQVGWQVKILSGDRDLFQLVDPEGQVQVLYLSSAYSRGSRSGVAQAFGPAEVLAKMEVRADQVVDYKALCGDSSDNIPGVKGIGHKTAVTLLKQFDTLENVYRHLDEIKGAVQTKLAAGKDEARHSQYLAQIHLDVPIAEDLQSFKLSSFDWTMLSPLLERLEIQSMTAQLLDLHQTLGGGAIALSTNTASTAAEDGDTWFFSAADTAVSPNQPTLAPQLVQNPKQLTSLVQHLQTCTDPQQPVAWDTETDRLTPQDAKLVGIGCCWGPEPDALAYIPLGHLEGVQLDCETVLKALQPILESSAYPKVLQNAKFDRLVLQAQGIALEGVVFDTMLASYVLNPEQKHNLSDLSERYLGIRAQSFSEIVPKGKTLADLSISEVAQYCGLDVFTTFGLAAPLQADLADCPKLRSLLEQVELPLEAVLAAMETWGIRIDQPYLHTLSGQLETTLAEIETAAHALAGAPFNLSSPKQLSQLLFETLQLDPKKSRKTTLGYSTDANTLEKMQGDHPIIDLILQHRTLAKLKSTYVDALPALVRADTQRVHTDFNQAVTATGRLSSSNPNLQNIPIRTEFSRQIRAAFIPQEGWELISADYSQIELRILAHLSQEERLLEAYQQRADVHTLTAQLLLEQDQISAEERRLGKIINFGVIYGMGAQRFAREAGVSQGQAKTFITRFYERYPKVFAFLQQMEQQAVVNGYVETILGRRRYFQFESSSLRNLKGSPTEAIALVDLAKLKMSNLDRGLLRAAANAPIQGSSADLIKLAMVQLAAKLDPAKVHMLIQVHDELVFEAAPDSLAETLQTIQTTMEQAIALTVPLVVEAHVGANWMEAK